AALASSTLNVFSSVVGAAFSASVGTLAATSWAGVIGVVLAFCVISLITMTTYYYFELVDKRKLIADAKQKQAGVLSNLEQLIVHKPHFSVSANGPAYAEASFFEDPVINTPALPHPEAEDAARVDAGGQSFTERWKTLRAKYGPSLRHDANQKVPV